MHLPMDLCSLNGMDNGHPINQVFLALSAMINHSNLSIEHREHSVPAYDKIVLSLIFLCLGT